MNTWLGKHAAVAMLLCSVVVPAASGGVSPVPTPKVTATGPGFAAIDEYVRAQMQANPIPGTALGIVQGGQVVHLQGFGVDVAGPGGRPVTAQTPFRVASVGKAFTGLAIRQLINSGKVDADSPVQRLIPWFRMADPQASALITVRHLLHHASGIPGDATAGVEFNETYTTEQMVRTLATVALDRPVGSSYEYANANFLILGLIIEAVSGQSYGEYVQQHIFAPLGMRHSYMSEAAAREDGLAPGHQPWFGIVLPTHEPFVTGMLPAGAATVSSAEDMARFASLYLTDGWYGGLSMVGSAPAGRDSNYDLYWNPGEGNRLGYVGQEGASPSYSAGLYISREQGWGAVVLANARLEYIGPGEGTTGGNIAEGVMRMLRGETPAPPTDRGFRQAVLLMDLGVGVLAVFLLSQIVLLRRWRRPLLARERRPAAVLLRTGLPIGLDIALAAVAFFGLPLLSGTPWPYLIGVMPDLSYTLLGAGVVLLGLAASKAVLAYLALHRPLTSSSARPRVEVERVPPMRSTPASGGKLRDWQRWAPYAAVVWSLAYAALGVYWAVSGRGFPYAAETGSGSDVMAPLLGRLGPGVAWGVIIMAGIPAAALGTAMLSGVRGGRNGALRPFLITAGALLAAVLLLLMTSLDLLVKLGYVPYTVFSLFTGAQFGQTYLESLTQWATIHQLLCLIGGFLWLAATICYGRRSAGACQYCGRRDGPEGWRSPDRAARWGRIAVYVAMLVPLFYALTRYAWALGFPLGMSEEYMRQGQERGTWTSGLFLATFAFVGAALMLGLVQRWGEVFPRWMIGLAGRRVPVALAVIVASLVSVLLVVGGIAIWSGLRQMIDALAAGGSGGMELIGAVVFQVGPTLLFPVWGVALAVATLGYYYRRRGPCAVCGRGASAESMLVNTNTSGTTSTSPRYDLRRTPGTPGTPVAKL